MIPNPEQAARRSHFSLRILTTGFLVITMGFNS